MCAICRKNPCDSRCPNAPEAKAAYICTECGGEIFHGDKYFDSPDGIICKDCMNDMTAMEILELLGEEFSVA